MKSILGNFSMDIVASCAYGVDPGCLDSVDKESEYITNAANIFKRGRIDLVKKRRGQLAFAKFLLNTK